MNKDDVKKAMARLGICVVVPTYNNAATLGSVLDSLGEYCGDVIVVNDGSPDATGELLDARRDGIAVIGYSPNRGKGYALMRGFREATARGFRYVVSIDSDGQHKASDLHRFIEEIETHPDALLVGSRNLHQENMPGGNTFANKFSNFWFRLHTFCRLPDTQSGYRLYPLDAVKGMRIFTRRYEAELELLVRAAWKGVEIRPVTIEVYYAPQGERVSSFRPGRDFTRISLLNAALTFGAVFYGWPVIGLRKLFNR